jgi:hypothetical protein
VIPNCKTRTEIFRRDKSVNVTVTMVWNKDALMRVRYDPLLDQFFTFEFTCGDNEIVLPPLPCKATCYGILFVNLISSVGIPVPFICGTGPPVFAGNSANVTGVRLNNDVTYMP